MTKGELISACIKLMFDNGNNEIDSSIISSDETYKDRTNNIIESINRAFIRLSQANKLGLGLLEIEYSSSNTTPKIEYNLNTLTSNQILKPKTIYKYNANLGVINANVSVVYLTTNNVLLPKLEEDEKYIIKYVKIPIKLNYSDEDTTNIDCEDYIVSIIPYFVKGELYEEDNPNLATLSMNRFEELMRDIPTQDEGEQRIVEDVYHNYFWGD